MKELRDERRNEKKKEKKGKEKKKKPRETNIKEEGKKIEKMSSDHSGDPTVNNGKTILN